MTFGFAHKFISLLESFLPIDDPNTLISSWFDVFVSELCSAVTVDLQVSTRRELTVLKISHVFGEVILTLTYGCCCNSNCYGIHFMDSWTRYIGLL